VTGPDRHVLRGLLVIPERVFADGVVAVDDVRISWVGDAAEFLHPVRVVSAGRWTDEAGT
jgi:hypothetical protein